MHKFLNALPIEFRTNPAIFPNAHVVESFLKNDWPSSWSPLIGCPWIQVWELDSDGIILEVLEVWTFLISFFLNHLSMHNKWNKPNSKTLFNLYNERLIVISIQIISDNLKPQSSSTKKRKKNVQNTNNDDTCKSFICVKYGRPGFYV